MKRRLVFSLLALSFVPALTFAQSGHSVTRAEVRSELAQLRQAGYDGDTDASYPTKLLEAQSRIASGHVGTSATDVGGRVSGSSQSGVAVRGNTGEIPGLRSIYSGN
ncbi:DUF4148 domain-containing protein [Paraburkholderia sp. Ac-20336]|uniref:DUF4148 domain-containing protein n=1 Tax=Burkholderiaceae TaxID=119060 RepID=UPI00141EB839|nr:MULTISPECIES: DUF4148 domain-containing protein [Burkholderiaceae]MBN3802371.1 DUF4148 domain-containing protein [Paraburkholderia sp. Ac-20336]MBN3845923.1 DUF4148 domain-containing protein [Paraburkholderia sp. Ac-20342]NIF55041.1 DUF4148 domain-containing protein [Burkholderia sp. Ax-1724]NIF77302.1 DUF4148 domain-containing protein [Paraburkholderia sp. Cy-641]